MKPVIIVNFKTYPEATAAKAERLAKICAEIAAEKKADIRVAVQVADIYRIASKVEIPVYAEHIDAIDPGRNTGFILAQDVRDEGAAGTLLNHSEHRLPMGQLREAAADAKKAKLRVVLCAATPAEAAKLAQLKPEFVAYEPPELIAGQVSVSEAKPEVIARAVKLVKVPLLVGAGIHSAQDIAVAMKLGARGVLLASSITTAKDPRKALSALLE